MSETEHLKPYEVAELVNDIIQRYQFPERCDFCMMAILTTLVSQVTYHGIGESNREDYLNEVLKNARTMIAGMELRLEHNNVRN